MERKKNCQTCGRFTECEKKVFGNDGICKLILKKPAFVKKTHVCKYWIDSRLLKGATNENN